MIARLIKHETENEVRLAVYRNMKAANEGNAILTFALDNAQLTEFLVVQKLRVVIVNNAGVPIA